MRFSPLLKISNPFAEKSPRDRNVMLICLGIAFFFWLIIKLSNDYQVTKVVELQFLPPPGKAFSRIPPKNMEVTLRGSGWNLLFEFISGNTIQLQYDLHDRSSFTLTEAAVRNDIRGTFSSGDVEIVQLSNYDLSSLALEDKATKTVPILPRYHLDFAEEYQLKSPVRVAPDSVTVTGPVSQVRDLQAWPTDSLALKNIRADYEGKLPLLKPTNNLAIEPQAVDVTIEAEQITEKTLYLPVNVINAPKVDSIRIFPDKIMVSCLVGLSQYRSLSAADFELVADLGKAEIQEGEKMVPVELTKQPDYVRGTKLATRAVGFIIVEK